MGSGGRGVWGRGLRGSLEASGSKLSRLFGSLARGFADYCGYPKQFAKSESATPLRILWGPVRNEIVTPRRRPGGQE